MLFRSDPIKEGKAFSSFMSFINETEEDFGDDMPEDLEEPIEDETDDFDDQSNWEEDEDEYRNAATQSNQTFSDQPNLPYHPLNTHQFHDMQNRMKPTA